VTGTVVHLSHGGRGYVVATSDGQLLAFHTPKAPTTLGDRLKVTVRALQNGTFQERSTKLLGHADKASFQGTVTFADQQAGTYTVSVRGVSLLVHLPPVTDPAAPVPQVPQVGVLTTVDVTVKQATNDPRQRSAISTSRRSSGTRPLIQPHRPRRPISCWSRPTTRASRPRRCRCGCRRRSMSRS
jgi:hypothetical protein